jgi:hypothetical protein
MTALDVLKLLVAASDSSYPDGVELAVDAAREILNGDQEELDDVRDGQPVDHLALFGFEAELYLADRYNLDAPDTAIVFANALGNTIAYNLTPDASIEDAITALVQEIRRAAEYRRANPVEMGLRDIIREYKRSGGKVRHS